MKAIEALAIEYAKAKYGLAKGNSVGMDSLYIAYQEALSHFEQREREDSQNTVKGTS